MDQSVKTEGVISSYLINFVSGNVYYLENISGNTIWVAFLILIHSDTLYISTLC